MRLYHNYIKLLLCPLVVNFIFQHDVAFGSVNNLPDQELRTAVVTASSDNTNFNSYFDAQVWLGDMSQRLSNRLRDNQPRVELLKIIHTEAIRAQLSPELVLAVIEVESNFDPWAISKSGAIGLMQVMPFWLNEIGKPNDNLHHAQTNLRIGCAILRHYIDQEKGDLTHALARYNGSYGKREYADKVLDALSQRWFRQ